MSKKKIIITYDADLDEETVVDCVQAVISRGRISEGRRGTPQYCYVTRFTGDVMVWARDKRKPDSADSFHVFKEKQ